MSDRTEPRWTHEADDSAGHLYYIGYPGARPAPYTHQREVTAIIDIADDGTLAGVELIDNMPPPPAATVIERDSRSSEELADWARRVWLTVTNSDGSTNVVSRARRAVGRLREYARAIPALEDEKGNRLDYRDTCLWEAAEAADAILSVLTASPAAKHPITDWEDHAMYREGIPVGPDRPVAGEWKLVPVKLTDEMRRAAWFAQAKFVGGTDEESEQLIAKRLADPRQREMDAAAYRAMLASSPAPASGEAVADANLEMLIRDIRPYAKKPAGSLRIDMEDVRSILALYDKRFTQPPAPTGLVEALTGNDPEMPACIQPIAWLSEAVDEMKRRGPEANCEDPGAYWEMVNEVAALLDACRAALAANGG